MEEAVNTECLRNMAPHWNLAGDKKLLCLLQDVHQKIMNRCQETNTKLEEMAITLDGANIDLQNVNNKFMALSNSQFIESRVYDDDLEVSVEENPTKTNNAATPNQDMELGLAKLKQSLMVLESMHECVRILDSDSESDLDEGDGRMVYRPKDLYGDRPLPHIIGSQAWKSKWHAGIIAEDSDSDSTTSKPENEALEQYSESESELTDTRTDRLNPPQRTISSNSSTVDSEPSVPPAPLSQANIAAELARKLAGNLPEIPDDTPEVEPEYTKPVAAPSQVYKPQNPPTSNIFFDEPPPIDQSYQSDKDDYNDEEDDDIFAELHRTKPSFTTNKDQTRGNQDLFGDFNNTPDVTADLFGTNKKEPVEERNNDEHPKETDKKPIGGISVFGSTKGTESIGAAILKRNQRKTYSSDEESEKEVTIKKGHTSKDTSKEKTVKNVAASQDIPIASSSSKDEPGEKTKERDILQDIFDKNKPTKTKKDEEISTKEKTDLFSDNLFDDIDDIFTDTIVKVPIKEASKNVKSIFDDDDDDLFADIAVTSKKETTSKSIDNKAGGLFDSDNDDYLFSEDPKSSDSLQKPVDNISKRETVPIIKKIISKSIFDDDSEDDIFSEIKVRNSPSDHMSNNALENVKKEETERLNWNNEVKVDDNKKSFSDNNIAIDSELPQCSTNIGESIVNNTSEQSNSIDDFNELNNSSQNNLKTETSIETRKINSEFVENDTDKHLSDRIEDSFEDGRNDPFTNTEHENKEQSVKDDVKPEDIHSKIIESENVMAYEKQFTNLVKSNLDNDMLQSTSNISLPKDRADSESEPNSEANSISYDTENLHLPTEPSVADPSSDIFTDVFNDIPPAFEKPKEPKKSKNVNALFDDDSDDEALFFKKNDIISDEKPDLGSVTKEDSLFSIFSDEPPAIDVDFTQKTPQTRKHEIEDSKNFDMSVPEESIGILTDNGQIFPSSTDSENHEKLTDRINNNKKSIGKLKSININIDVNTLLPGAIPKKNKVVEQVDGQVASSINITKNDTADSESKIVKSVSFEGEADSGLLDNKLSKGRAKIQVKRRPSTRRARREAVKKSGIDFVNNDITDDTNGVDHAETVSEIATLDDAVGEIVKDSTIVEKDREQNVKSKIVYILNDEDIFSNSDTNKNASQSDDVAVSNSLENSQHSKSDITTSPDDDIFKKMNIAKVRSTSEVSSTEKSQNEKYKNTDKSDEVFQNKMDVENKNPKKSTENKASIFDDLSDEESELFQGKKSREPNPELNPKKKNIFGSDSEEELFTNNVKKPHVPKEEMPKSANAKVLVKKSLFDDDSDDDLFNSKTNSSGSKQFFSKTNEVKPIQTQSVDEDPLSILHTQDEVNYI